MLKLERATTRHPLEPPMVSQDSPDKVSKMLRCCLGRILLDACTKADLVKFRV